MQVTALDHLVLTVSDMEATIRFYEALGMRAESFEAADGSVRRALLFGAQKINLHPAEAPFEPHAARALPGTADLCLLTDAPLGDWEAHLEREGLTPILGPVPRTGAAGPIASLYLHDPDGNLIEIARPDP